eukprot:UN05858
MSIQTVYDSLDGASILSLNAEDIDLRELSKRITIEQQSKRNYKILRYNKRKMDVMLLLMCVFLIAVSYDLVSASMSFDWTDFTEPLYISPYPNLYAYIAHYLVDVLIGFVLIVWIHVPSKCCRRIRRDSIIALVCCGCCIVDDMDDKNKPFIYNHRDDFDDATFKRCQYDTPSANSRLSIHAIDKIFVTPATDHTTD